MGDCLYALPGQMSVALQAAAHATHAHNRNWRQRPADGVNEQRTWPRFLLLVARCFRSLLRFFHIYIYYTRFNRVQFGVFAQEFVLYVTFFIKSSRNRPFVNMSRQVIPGGIYDEDLPPSP